MLFDFLKKKKKKDIGLVLCGGGALGAYQMGAWRAIKEAGLEKRITGVSGTSIGACNTAIFCNGDLEKGERIWKEAEQKDLTYPNNHEIQAVLKEKLDEITFDNMKSNVLKIKDDIKDILSKDKRREEREMEDLVAKREHDGEEEDATFVDHLGRSFSWFYDNVKTAVFSQEGIEKIIDEKITLTGGRFDKLDLFCAATVLGEKVEPLYFCWNGRSPEEIKNAILASAAIPVAFNERVVDGKTCVDGGLVDNRPIKPLYDLGYRKFIVVNLDNEKNFLLKREMKEVEKTYGDCKFIHIIPTKEFNDSPLSRMKINRQLTMKRMVMGYVDAKLAIQEALESNGNRF